MSRHKTERKYFYATEEARRGADRVGMADGRFSEKSQRAGGSPQGDTIRNDEATEILALAGSKWASALTEHQQWGNVALDGRVPGGCAGIKDLCAHAHFAGGYTDPR